MSCIQNIKNSIRWGILVVVPNNKFVQFSSTIFNLSFLTSLVDDFTVWCLVLDFFFLASEVASQLNIPYFHFFTLGATALSMFLNLNEIFKTKDNNFKDLHSLFFDLLCISSVSLSHLPESLLVRDTPECLFIRDYTAYLTKSDEIIVNTFESLKPRAITKFKSSSKNYFCVPLMSRLLI